jgi:hypothetical protein
MGESVQEQNQQLLDKLAQQIGSWQLTLPAILFLQVTRPLSFIASQCLLLCQPLLGFFYDTQRITDYAELLADRANIDCLVAQLEKDSRLKGNHDEEIG